MEETPEANGPYQVTNIEMELGRDHEGLCYAPADEGIKFIVNGLLTETFNFSIQPPDVMLITSEIMADVEGNADVRVVFLKDDEQLYDVTENIALNEGSNSVYTPARAQEDISSGEYSVKIYINGNFAGESSIMVAN